MLRRLASVSRKFPVKIDGIHIFPRVNESSSQTTVDNAGTEYNDGFRLVGLISAGSDFMSILDTATVCATKILYPRPRLLKVGCTQQVDKIHFVLQFRSLL